MKNKLEIAYVALPLILWPISFILLKNVFIYAMLGSTFILAMLSLYLYKDKIKFNSGNVALTIAVGIAGALLLYFIFFLGLFVSQAFGFYASVANVYSSIYANSNTYILLVSLALIGVFEEVYWRGGIIFLSSKIKEFKEFPWLAVTLYYAAVHILTLNLVLALAAFFVGLVTSMIAYKRGILASIITHLLWIEAIIIFLPLLHV